MRAGKWTCFVEVFLSRAFIYNSVTSEFHFVHIISILKIFQYFYLLRIGQNFTKRISLGPQLNGHVAQTHIANLNSVLDNLTKLLCMLVSQSFVVAVQPEPVLKTQHKFLAEVRLLIGDRLGIKQHLVNTNVTVRIIAEEEARLLSIAQLSEKNV